MFEVNKPVLNNEWKVDIENKKKEKKREKKNKKGVKNDIVRKQTRRWKQTRP